MFMAFCFTRDYVLEYGLYLGVAASAFIVSFCCNRIHRIWRVFPIIFYTIVTVFSEWNECLKIGYADELSVFYVISVIILVLMSLNGIRNATDSGIKAEHSYWCECKLYLLAFMYIYFCMYYIAYEVLGKNHLVVGMDVWFNGLAGLCFFTTIALLNCPDDFWLNGKKILRALYGFGICVAVALPFAKVFLYRMNGIQYSSACLEMILAISFGVVLYIMSFEIRNGIRCIKEKKGNEKNRTSIEEGIDMPAKEIFKWIDVAVTRNYVSKYIDRSFLYNGKKCKEIADMEKVVAAYKRQEDKIHTMVPDEAMQEACLDELKRDAYCAIMDLELLVL